MKRGIAALVVCAALAAPVHAAGMRTGLGTPLEQRMERAAREYWTARVGDRHCSLTAGRWRCHTAAVVPKCGEPIIRRAWSAFGPDVASDAWAFVWHSGVRTCVIHLVSTYWTPAEERAEYPLLCRMFAHEYGHLLGFWDEGSDTMFSHYISDRVPDRFCAR